MYLPLMKCIEPEILLPSERACVLFLTLPFIVKGSGNEEEVAAEIEAESAIAENTAKLTSAIEFVLIIT